MKNSRHVYQPGAPTRSRTIRRPKAPANTAGLASLDDSDIRTFQRTVFSFDIPHSIHHCNSEQKKAAGAIAALNILFGRTIVGWIVILFWAMNKKTRVPRTPPSALMATFPPLLVTSTEKECPGCAGMVAAEATKCRFCALDLTALPTAQ
jgi:Superinfection immunity protein